MTVTAHTPINVDPTTLLTTLTLEEKASLLSGSSFWETQPITRDGDTLVPSIFVTDGPHGLRKANPEGDGLGLHDSIPATCFPPAVGLGSTWNRDLLHRVGAALGVESAAENVAVLLGPGINIKRSPLCGRNFEYLSEDPALTGELGAAIVQGIQSQGVGTSLKHFAVNNQETDRMRVSAEVDERTMREIYLAGFERVVKQANPWTLMCSYNRINGVQAAHHEWLLTTVLRDEWGFDGLVMSDWGAVSDRVKSVVAGLDLEMPATGGLTDAEIVAAVRNGHLDEKAVDACVANVLTLINRCLPTLASVVAFDKNIADAHHALAREAARESIVLLENDGVLPLAQQRIAVIGEFARTPRYQGAGSSQVNPTQLDSLLESLRVAYPQASFAPGFTLNDSPQPELLAEAVAVAAAAEVVVLCLGLPAAAESEGYDRTHINLPQPQLDLLQALKATGARLVVVLSNGSAVEIASWRDGVAAIVEGWLLGQAGGAAMADVLTGVVSPSGRLAETIPVRLEDTPSFVNFPGHDGVVRYGEGLFVGYRGFDAQSRAVAYPFGHGLSYTTFEYGAVTCDVAGEVPGLLTNENPPAGQLSVVVTNTGSVPAHEVVQLYVGTAVQTAGRPLRELKNFAKVYLEPGESTTVSLPLYARDLAYYSERRSAWVVDAVEYQVSFGASSRDLRRAATVTFEVAEVLEPLTRESTIEEFFARPQARAVLRAALGEDEQGNLAGVFADADLLTMLLNLPVYKLVTMGFGVTVDSLTALIAAANE